MTSKQRLLTTMSLKEPDCVPVTPDTSVMIPCRMTGKPYWDVLLYGDPPLWKAYIDVMRHFDFDGFPPYWWVDGLDEELLGDVPQGIRQECIVAKTDERIITRIRTEDTTGVHWSNRATVYFIDQPESNVTLESAGLSPGDPESYQVVKKNYAKRGLALYRDWYEAMGDHGICGVPVGGVFIGADPDNVMAYYDNPDVERLRFQAMHKRIMAFANKAIAITPKPDAICTGASGWLTFQSPEIFMDISFENLRDLTALAKRHNIKTTVHCCGRERWLVELAATRTDLSCIDPLEIAPMGDCNLAEIKRLFGKKICLKGNLHTTEVMLRGTVEQVKRAAKQAIDDAAAGGGFILSTGDQVGRDTPFENIHAMVEVARTYGKYR